MIFLVMDRNTQACACTAHAHATYTYTYRPAHTPALAAQEENGQPIWKHSTEDLCLVSAKFKGNDDGWGVCHWTTLATRKQVSNA